MNNGGKGDMHSTNSVKWKRNNFHQPLASDACDLAGLLRYYPK